MSDDRIRRTHEPQDETLKAFDRLVTWVDMAFHQMPSWVQDAWRYEYDKAEAALKKALAAEYHEMGNPEEE